MGDGMTEHRCAACEATMDVLDMCPECTPKIASVQIKDTCKMGHLLVLTLSGRRRCRTCSNAYTAENRRLSGRKR
jgi:hypothetical protein